MTSSASRPSIATASPRGARPSLTPEQIVPSLVGTGRIAGPLRGDPSDGVNVSLVPDGVARVKWMFTGAGYGIPHPRPVIVFAAVHGNVAAAPVTPGQGPLAAAVWYGTGGRVIASGGPGANASAQLKRIGAVNASRKRPIARVLIAHYALFRTVPPEDLARDHVLPRRAWGP